LWRGAAHNRQQQVMVDPVGPDDGKAQRIDQKLRYQRRQEARPKLATGGSLRQLQFEHHDGNDDGDDAVTESGDPLHARTIAAVLDLPHFPPANAGGTRLALPCCLAARWTGMSPFLPVPTRSHRVVGVLDLALGENTMRPWRWTQCSLPSPVPPI